MYKVMRITRKAWGKITYCVNVVLMALMDNVVHLHRSSTIIYHIQHRKFILAFLSNIVNFCSPALIFSSNHKSGLFRFSGVSCCCPFGPEKI